MTGAGAVELNLDGLVGPSHQFAGLAWGNVAAMASRASVSNPRAAALQGLRKMGLLMEWGVPQGVLPPQERPHLGTLRRLGFGGSDTELLARALREAPELFCAASSSSSMWAANAATVCPSADAADGRVHFTPANLSANLHRSLEPAATAAVLRLLFPESGPFVHHEPLPAGAALCDEGAANHLRLAPAHGRPGVQVFVFGRRALPAEGRSEELPARFPARQTFEASAAVARLHRLRPAHVLFARQSTGAVDAGVFHNDVVAVANESLLLYHREGYADPDGFAEAVRDAYARLSDEPPCLLEVSEERLPLAEAVATYLFNSQLVTLPEGGTALLVPEECRESDRARGVLQELVDEVPDLRRVAYVDLRESMRNGGGPACLRLRVVLTPDELAAVRPGAVLTPELHRELVAWVEKRYRDRLAPADMADPLLLRESREALDELTGLLGLGSIYPFQREG